jgi:hypothetical protein
MAAFNKIQDFVEQLGLAIHNLNTHTLKVALNRSDAAAGAGAAVQATDTILANVVQPTGTGYTAGGIDTLNTWAEAAGTGTLTGTKAVWTAGAADWQSFRYVVLHNDDATSPADALIGYWDYGSDLTLGNGETFSVKFNNSDTTGTILTIA